MKDILPGLSVLGRSGDALTRRCCWASCRARRIFLSSSSSSSSELPDPDDDDDDDDDSLALSLALLLLLTGKNNDDDCTGVFNSWFLGTDDELAAVSEIFEFE
jgi:hypothetical protein